MKRSIIVFGLLLGLMLSAGEAMAKDYEWYGYNTSATITDVIWNNGLPGKYGPTHKTPTSSWGVNGHREWQFGQKGDSYIQMDYVDKSFRMKDDKNFYFIDGFYGIEKTYMHLDFRKEDDNGYMSPSKFTVRTGNEFLWGERKKGEKGAELAVDMDFYYLADVDSRHDLVYIIGDSFYMGSFEYKGTTYHVELINDFSDGSRAADKLEGALYKQAYDHAIAMGASVAWGDELYGMTIKEGDKRHWKFDLVISTGGYNPPPVPVPAAVWLMGTGLAGLVALRRKNK